MPPELSERFESEVRAQQLASTRRYTAVIILFSLLFIIPDALFLRDSFEYIAVLRLIVAGLSLAAVFSLKWLSVIQGFSVLAIGMLLFNAMVVYIGIISSSHGVFTYQQGTVLIIIYCCTLFQSPLLHSSLIVVGCTLTYLVGILGFSDTDIGIVVNNGMIFSTAAVLGILAVIQRERYLKQHFLDTLQLEKQNKVASNQALTDALTGLPNRYSIMTRLESYKGLVPERLLIMMIDVDNFKRLNDELGHGVGDVALTNLSKTLSECIEEEQGYIARYGGEEFLVFLENVSRTHGKKVCETLVKNVREAQFTGLPPITISLGGYYTTGLERTLSECIETADQTLLEVKREGKDNYKIKSLD